MRGEAEVIRPALLLLAVLLAMPTAQGADIHGNATDIFRYGYGQRPDLYSHAGVTGACTIVGGYALRTLDVRYADEIGAVGCFLAVSSKEWQDQWIDRGDIGANVVGAAVGYIIKKALPDSPIRVRSAGGRVLVEWVGDL